MTVQVQGKLRDKTSGEGVGEVLVSNGEHVVRTGADGGYVLQAEAGTHSFVWVSVPDGFRPVDHFYQAVPEKDGELDFDLVSAPERSRRSFRLVQVTDTHVEEGQGRRSSSDVLSQDLQELVRQSRPDLIVHSGDLTQLGTLEQLRCFHQAIETIEPPVFPLFGNHDGSEEFKSRDGEDTCTRNYGQIFGPAYYSFDWGGRHFVLYADVDWLFAPADQERKAAWLWADLALQPAGREIVVVIHMPPSMGFVEQLRRFNVVAVLYGHWHSSKVFSDAGIPVAATQSLCFGGIDTEPRGYRLLEFSEREIEVGYRALQEPVLQAAEPATVSLGDRELTLLWKTEIPGEIHRAAPVCWEDSILVSLRDESLGKMAGLRCLDAGTGQLRWQVHSGTSIKNSVAVDGKGRCALVSVSGRVWLLDAATGDEHWVVDLPGYPNRWVYLSPVIADGAVYVGAKEGYGKYDLGTGEQLWYAPLDSQDNFPFWASPLAFGELLIVLQQDRGLRALQRSNGEIAWEQELGVEYQYGTPVLAGDLIVSGGGPKCLVALRAHTGEMVWNKEVLEDYPSGLATSGERIFASTPSGRIQCFDLRTGDLCWEFQTGIDLLDMTPYSRGKCSVLAAPVVWGERVVAGGNDGVLYLLDAASGACVSQTRFGAPISAAPCVLREGICVGTWDGRLYCFTY